MSRPKLSELFAHTDAGREPELLSSHANHVAKLARQLASKFDAGDLGYSAGLLHDLGKAKPAFQRKLFGEKNDEPHSAEGARFAQCHFASKMPRPFDAPVGRLLAFVIAGHHAGLANGATDGGGTRSLDDRLALALQVEPWFSRAALPTLSKPPAPLQSTRLDPFGFAFFIRMLFSALVDADFLETERWFNEGKLDAVPRGTNATLQDLKLTLDAHLSALTQSSADGSDLSRLRAEVLADCRAAATHPTGLYSLTVPTGGGKTLSSLAFALDHALNHGLDRVIYVIPFTSIVEQTADVFRKALRDSDAVLEHHSAFDDEKLKGRSERETDYGVERLRLAAQNWDRPVVVTTAVQFFESLFANKTGRCRKLHNIAGSVVILDEAQTLPVKLLRPCLAAIDTLVRSYRSSIVLCTATQPALTEKAGLKAPERLRNVREIIPESRHLFTRLKRVKAEVSAETLTDAQLVAALAGVDQGLVILNNRRHARELFQAFERAGLEGARHLTTAMTARHRQQVLDEIRDDLKSARPVRLVSTSLIEAGVDISFKAVWRAWAGLDQMVQAAGRCNRNGELGPEGGRLTIFTPEEGEGRGIPRELKPNIEAAKYVLADAADPLSEEAVDRYFEELLWRREDGGHFRQLDNVKVGDGDLAYRGIMKALDETKHGLNFPFADIAQAFRIIEEAMVPVIIPATVFAVDWAPDDAFLNSIEHRPSLGGVARSLQPHIVQIPRKARAALIDVGSAYALAPGKLGEQFVVLSNRELYSAEHGLDWDNPTFRSVESLMY